MVFYNLEMALVLNLELMALVLNLELIALVLNL
jgi:hypothetical protein